jgi:hypothetical protein
MSTPFFSICLPTKNRAWLLHTAITSVLRQTFTDFEIVVTDNDDGDDTAGALAKFDDPRIRHVRTGGLSMPDNWEAAAAAADGKFVCFLEDKQTYKFDSLERVHALIQEHAVEAVRWQSDALIECPGGTRLRRARRGEGDQVWSSDDILRHFTHEAYGATKRLLPLGQFSAVSNALIERVRQSAVGRLCPPMSPDYTMAIGLLAHTDRVLVTSDALVVFSTVSVSNGIDVREKKGGVAKLAKELGRTEIGFYDRVPIKTVTISNSVFNDYVHVQDALNERLGPFQIDWANYFQNCFDSIGTSAGMGVDVSDELGAWEAAFAAQPAEVQARVSEQVGGADPGARKTALATQFTQKGALDSGLFWAKSMMRRHVLRKADWRYDDVLNYLEQDYRERNS